MGVNIAQFYLKGMPAITQRINSFIAGPEQLDIYLDPVIINDIRKRWKDKETPEGKEWAPLTKKYLEWKRRWGFPEDLMILTGELLRVASNPKRIKRGWWLTYRLEPPIFSIFHGKKLRRFWGLSQEARDKITEVVKDWVYK